MTVLVPILGDQLSERIASLRGLDRASTRVLMMEVAEEATYVRHHKKKIAFLFSAMRHYAERLRAAGWQVDYIALDDPANTGSFTGEVGRAVERHRPSSIRIAEAGELRVKLAIAGWSARFGVPVEVLPDDRFFCPIEDFVAWARPRRRLVMEDFYRKLRTETGILMDGGRPAGGQWNYDRENRKAPPRGLNYPAPHRVEPDAITREVLALVAARFAGHFGDLEPFALPVTRADALVALDHFVQVSLPGFGDYQDAMLTSQEYLYHSILSPLINCGLLEPREVVDAAVAAYEAGDAPLNSVEGFVRQILGWREYMRGIYWLEMPGLDSANALDAHRPLPDFYWTGETDMRCLREAVGQTKREAYAHHIQRLMVLGNFAMLAGVDPKAVADWFLVVYFDAYEWVEHPNVIGMSQYADGGRLGSKPYAGSGAYIDRMSDYCGRCRYDVSKKTGPDACPFNALYWDFLARNESRLRGNERLRNMYATWGRMGEDKRRAYRESAAAFLATLQPAGPGWARGAPDEVRPLASQATPC